MADINAQDVAGAAAANEDAAMVYIDRLVAAAGVEDVNQDDDFDDDWSMGTDGGDNEDEGDERYMYDEGESKPVRVNVNALWHRYQQGPAAAETAPTEEPRGLSEGAKTHLTWRLDKDESFSDWTIEISVEEDGTSQDQIQEIPASQLYHVHKATLATGPRKSEYWNGIFTSGQFQESGESMSRIAFHRNVAAAFPDFLDYLYAPYPEADRVLKTKNAMQLKKLAGYFIVQPLSDAADAFIRKDMRNVHRLEKYLAYAIEYEYSDLVSDAVGICANSIDLIKDDDPLLFAMPPAFLLTVFQSLRNVYDRQIDPVTLPDNVRRRMFSLLLSYVRHHDENGYLFNERYLELVSKAVSRPDSELSGFYDNALYFLQMVKRKAMGKTYLEHLCKTAIFNFLLKDRCGDDQIDLIIESTPTRVSRLLMKAAFTKLRQCPN